MNQIAQVWRKLNEEIQQILKKDQKKLYSDLQNQIFQYFNYLINIVSESHKSKDHQVQELVFVEFDTCRKIQCKDCFKKQLDNDFKYSIDLISAFQDIQYFVKSVLRCFQNSQQFDDEKLYHNLNQFQVTFQTFNNKNQLDSNFILKLQQCIVECKRFMCWDNVYQKNFNGLNRVLIDQFIEQVRIKQKQLEEQKHNINLAPKIVTLNFEQIQQQLIYQLALSKNYVAFLLKEMIQIYNISDGSIIYQVNINHNKYKTSYFKFTFDNTYLITGQQEQNFLMIFNIRDQTHKKYYQPSLSHFSDIQFQKGYLNQINDAILQIQYDHSTKFQFQKLNLNFIRNSQQREFLKAQLYFDQINGKWKIYVRNIYMSRIQLRDQIWNRFRLQEFDKHNRIGVYYSLNNKMNKKIRRIPFSQNKTYFSKNDRYAFSTDLNFYDLIYGKIVFSIGQKDCEDIQDIIVEDKYIKLVTYNTIYVYEQCSNP